MAATDKEFLECPHPGIAGRTNENRAAEPSASKPSRRRVSDGGCARPAPPRHQQAPRALPRSSSASTGRGLDVQQGIGSESCPNLADKLTKPSTLQMGYSARAHRAG